MLRFCTAKASRATSCHTSVLPLISQRQPHARPGAIPGRGACARRWQSKAWCKNGSADIPPHNVAAIVVGALHIGLLGSASCLDGNRVLYVDRLLP
jgi:hypothetical protein